MKLIAPADLEVVGVGTVTAGEEVDVPDHIAVSLQAQGWKTAKPAKTVKETES